MTEKQERLMRRNKEIRIRFEKKRKAQPKWTFEAVVQSIANEFFLSVRTIDAIISYEGIYRKTK
ncbi:hypothetical protein QLS31_15250 [Flavobacterium sp. XS2P24]|uniref:hypothetical protein n=1 Tax=Flavobacterium sp. XS2P24 TaxID=3041249 RepID=UPI0024A818C4|nr:hypothetical protein [Flavobacterium sp. XS2P24]MDI6051184.1 hypothetical protein [Flavobacterium sp. XS2P24]